MEAGKLTVRMPKPKVVAGAIFVALMLLGLSLMPQAFAESTETSLHNVTVDVAYNMITSGSFPDVVILDVRYQYEYDSGHLYNAVLIPYNELETRIGELEEYKNHEIIVYCRSGYRSAIACEILVDHGFTKVYNVLGGILAWIEAGYPIYTTFHLATVNIVDEEILLEIEPMPPLPPSGCPCNESPECPSCESEFTFVNLTVLEEDEDYRSIVMVYEGNGTTLEVTIATTKLWSYALLSDEYNITATFMKTEIAVEDQYSQFYSLGYLVRREEYDLTVYTRLKPLNPGIFETSFTEMNYMPTGKSEIVSMESVEINSSVTFSQQYAVLGEVAKEMGKVYEKSGDETLAQLAQNYYTIKEEAKYLSKLVEKGLKEYDREILESSAVLMDHPKTCTWILWWKVCIDWCSVLVSYVMLQCPIGCAGGCCLAAPPLCSSCYIICTTGCRIAMYYGADAFYNWCVNFFNCPIHWLT